MKHIFVFAIVIIALFVCYTGEASAVPFNTYLYVSNYNGNSISVINPSTLTKVTDISVDSMPSDVLVNPAGTLLYVAYDGAKYVDVYNTLDYSLQIRIPIPVVGTVQKVRMAINPAGTRLFLTAYQTGQVVSVDLETNTIINSVTVGQGPNGILYHNNSIYVTLFSNDTVLRMDDDLAYLEVKGVGTQIFNKSSSIVYNPVTYAIEVLNSNSTITTFHEITGTYNFMNYTRTTVNPGSICVNGTGCTYMVEESYDNVTVFTSQRTIATNVTFSANTFMLNNGCVADDYNNTVFVAAKNKNMVYMIDSSYTVYAIPAGIGPYRISIGTQAAAYQHQVKFVVQSLYGLFKYDNVTVTVYDNNKVMQYSQKTDTSGQVAFYLQPTVSYTVWANSTTDSINETITVVPYDSTYYFNVWSFFSGWNPFGWIQNNNGTGGVFDVNKDIRMNYSVDTASSPRVVLLNYSDASASTSAVNFTLLRFWQENSTYTVYNTTIVAGSAISYRQMPISVPAADADGQSYQIVVTGTTSAYGIVKRMDSYHFPGVSYPMPGLPTEWYPYIALGVILLFGLFFTYLSSGLGLIVMAFWGIVFMYMGWLTWNNAFLLLLQVIAIFGVGQIFKMKRQREGV